MKITLNIENIEHQPQIFLDDEGKVTKIIIEAPFVKTTKVKGIEGKDTIVTISNSNSCKICGIEKTRDKYYPSIGNTLGVQNKCIVCTKEERRKKK